MVQDTGISRRRLLQRGAAAGAVAWTAPLVLSAPARADSVCTPKCLPKGSPRFSASAVGVCDNNDKDNGYTVTVTLSLDTVTSPVLCECGGTATVKNGILQSSLRVGLRGTITFFSNPDVLVTCVDASGDDCSVSCSVEVDVLITGNPGNDCSKNVVTVTAVRAGCTGVQPLPVSTF